MPDATGFRALSDDDLAREAQVTETDREATLARWKAFPFLHALLLATLTGPEPT